MTSANSLLLFVMRISTMYLKNIENLKLSMLSVQDYKSEFGSPMILNIVGLAVRF